MPEHSSSSLSCAFPHGPVCAHLLWRKKQTVRCVRDVSSLNFPDMWQDFSSFHQKAAVLPITSVESTSLPALTDDFDLCEHREPFTAWYTYIEACRRERVGVGERNVEDEELIPIFLSTQGRLLVNHRQARRVIYL